MAGFTQNNRPLRVLLGDVPLDGVLLLGLTGTESVSRLFRYVLDLVSPADTPLNFADVLGKPTAVAIDQVAGQTRFIHGIVNRFSQGRRDQRFNHYRAELVPPLWLLTKSIRSRVFQLDNAAPMTTKAIVELVIGGLYSPDFGGLEQTYQPRNICVQYRESDFAFISRLMEEEGIYYYFTHTADDHKLVIADSTRGHQPVPQEMPLVFQDEGQALPNEGRVTRWDKAQELRGTSVTTTDYHFQIPNNPLQGVSLGLSDVNAGTVDHNLSLGGMDKAEIVEHPGGYAHWRDGVAPGGGDRAADLQPLIDDSEALRISGMRMDLEATRAVRIEGASTYCRLTAGHKFTLSEHFDADGDYVVTTVNHRASCGVNESGGATDFNYTNAFECIPAMLAFRPEPITPRPVVKGTQTAVVVGDDPDVDPDKYGRVKIHFRWDPQGARGLQSSCWVRVAQFWAGRQWGAQFIPRVGDEVVVSFHEGDPDQPIIIGSVYNDDNMPIYKLPDNKTQSGIKTHSIAKGTTQNFNELRFEDKKGHELVLIHAEKNMSTTVEANETVNVGVNSSTTVANNNTVTIGTDAKGDPHTHGKSTTTVFGDTSFTISKGDHTFTVAEGKSTSEVKGAVTANYGDVWQVTSKLGIKFESATKSIELIGAESIKLTSGASSLEMKKDGTITIAGVNVSIDGSAGVKITGAKIDALASALATVKGALVKINC